MTNRKARKFTMFLWHRRIGLVAILLVIVLSITGIMLNHTERFKLDSTYVDSSFLLSWYGLEPDSEPVSYGVDESTFTQWGSQLFLDEQPIAEYDNGIRGAIMAEKFIVVAFERDILLLTPSGELVESIPTESSFADIARLGVKQQRPVVETVDGSFYIADEHIIDWSSTVADDALWSQSTPMSDEKMAALKTGFRGQGLSLERVVLDLHSGRIFGAYGIYVMDAAAIALLWLSLSGLWVWNSRRIKMGRKRHFQKHHRS